MELGILLATTHAIVTLKRRIRAPNTTDAMNIKAAIPCPLLSSLFCSRVLPWLIDDIDVSGFLVEFRSVNNMYQLIVSYSFITHNHKSMLFWWLLSQIYQLIWAAVMSSMHFWFSLSSVKIYILTDWMKKKWPCSTAEIRARICFSSHGSREMTNWAVLREEII